MSTITFPGVIPYPDGLAIGCRSKPSPIEGIHVEVAPLDPALLGKRIVYSWVGCSDKEGKNPIEETRLVVLDRTVEEADIKTGFKVHIEHYYDVIKPIRDGSGRFGYTVEGSAPVEALVQIRLLNSSGQTCDEFNP